MFDHTIKHRKVLIIFYLYFATDSDGDKITITKATDFELFLEQNISKMNVEVIEGTAWKSIPTESAAPPRSNDEIRSIHHEGILCDVCDKDVYGFRYKCLDCEEFDMCMDCQTTQIHKEHLLLRITNPIDGEKNFELRVVPGENNPEYE